MHCFTTHVCAHRPHAEWMLHDLCTEKQFSRNLKYRIAGKVDGEINLAIGVETTKLKSANIISCTTHNDVLHAVALLAPTGAPLHKAVHVGSLTLAHCQFYFL